MEKIEMANLDKAMDKIGKEVKERNKKLRACNVKRATLAEEAEALSKQIRNKEFRLQLLQEHSVLVKGVSAEVSDMRNSLLGLRAELPRKDITIACREELEVSIKKLEKNLIAVCGHQFLVGYSGYSGSQYDDYTDAFHGRRMCVVCGYSEHAKLAGGRDEWGRSTETFPSLNDSQGRLIERHDEFSRDGSYGSKGFDIWRPLEELLEMYVDKRVYQILKEIA
ncbi:MAG: hypothetical protein HY226_02815 [Candidatus Vogelbacteria bacterium]|nr:hypothetical protein [Candidatus Vogelbacteria bacterium]